MFIQIFNVLNDSLRLVHALEISRKFTIWGFALISLKVLHFRVFSAAED